MFKKTLLLLAIAAMLIVGLGNVAMAEVSYDSDCPNAPATNPKHQWVAFGGAQPTCNQPGQQAYYCGKCDDWAYVTISATGNHSYGNWEIVKEPTCNEPGEKKGTCTTCYPATSAATKTETIPATGNHSYEEVIDEAATCGKEGKKHKECSVCHDVLGTSYTTIPATEDHTYEEVIDEAATCGKEGKKHKECSVCHEVLGTSYTTIPATGDHELSGWIVETPATCTTDGLQRKSCQNCAYSESETIEATGHDTGSWVVTKEATCEEEGSRNRQCTKCDYVWTTESIEALGHKWEKSSTSTETQLVEYCPQCKGWKVTDLTPAEPEEPAECEHEWEVSSQSYDATCELGGQIVKYCAKCDKWDVQYTEALGHKWEKSDLSNENQLVEYCPQCEGWKTTDLRPVEPEEPECEHEWEESSLSYDATCEFGGQIVKYCAKCETWDVENTPAKGHDYSCVETAATCTEEGLRVYTCQTCGDEQTEVLPMAEHTKIKVRKAVESTCTTNGRTEGFECAVCGIKVRSKRLPKLCHTPIDVPAKAPTCTEYGYGPLKACAICDEALTEYEVYMPTHTPIDVPAKAPTCTEYGHGPLQACAYCDEALTEYEVYMPTGHGADAYSYDDEYHYAHCADCGELLRYDEHELTTTVRRGRVITECKWCDYRKVTSNFGK